MGIFAQFVFHYVQIRIHRIFAGFFFSASTYSLNALLLGFFGAGLRLRAVEQSRNLL